MTDMPEITLTCSKCGRPMVERENRQSGARFMSCTFWPDFCSETAKIPAWLEMKRAGGLTLPGFGDEPDDPDEDILADPAVI